MLVRYLLELSIMDGDLLLQSCISFLVFSLVKHLVSCLLDFAKDAFTLFGFFVLLLIRLEFEPQVLDFDIEFLDCGLSLINCHFMLLSNLQPRLSFFSRATE